MICKVEEIAITEESYPFASAEKYCGLSQKGYEEKEYYIEGTSNVYRTEENGSIGIKNANVPYVNRIIVRRPKKVSKFSGNVVVEIINATSLMEIDRMWILGYSEFVRSGDIYVGITSKPATFAKLLEFDKERYSRLSWPNPTPDISFPFTVEEAVANSAFPDLDIHVETGLFWDMATDLAVLLKQESEMNPLAAYKPEKVVLTGWSQSANYLIRYINDFAYKDDSEKSVYDGFMVAGPVRYFNIPVNQYETARPFALDTVTVKKVKNPTILMQTESENGRFEACRVRISRDADADYLFREYDVTGASHDTVDSYVDYYQNDSDLVRINHLPVYLGKNAVANNYPTHFLVAAMYRNLFYWIKTGMAPAPGSLIELDADGENKKDALGISIGGLRTCLLDYPTGAYYNTSDIEKGANFIFPDSDKEFLFGHEEPYPVEMLRFMYGSLDHYEELVRAHTKRQVLKGVIVKEDMEELVQFAVELAKKRGLS